MLSKGPAYRVVYVSVALCNRSLITSELCPITAATPRSRSPYYFAGSMRSDFWNIAEIKFIKYNFSWVRVTLWHGDWAGSGRYSFNYWDKCLHDAQMVDRLDNRGRDTFNVAQTVWKTGRTFFHFVEHISIKVLELYAAQSALIHRPIFNGTVTKFGSLCRTCAIILMTKVCLPITFNF